MGAAAAASAGTGTATREAAAAAALLAGVATYQAAAAAGAPFGRHVWGGRYEAVLPPRMRAASGTAAVVLAAMAVVVLTASGRLRPPLLGRRAARRATGVLAGYFALNTAGNLASKSVAERVGMGAVTAALTVLTARVARSGAAAVNDTCS